MHPPPTESDDRLATRLRRARGRHQVLTHTADVLDPGTDTDRGALHELAADPGVRVVDTVEEQLDELVRSRAPDRDLDAAEVARRIAELVDGTPLELFGSWVHHPWSRTLAHVLPAALHRELRLDRNRHKITSTEQARLLTLRIAVAGLSVGRSAAETLVREGIGGEIRLADFDTLSLSNLNRVPGGVADVGVNKAALAARAVAELDPYLRVVVHPDGVRPETLDAFLDGVDVLLDECDDLEMKVLLRERARAAGLPVVMVTSDRGLIDIERFDREPGREPFHGMLARVRAADLHGLTTRQKVPYVLRILDAQRLDARAAASLVEVKQTLWTWPQLASDVVLGGAMAANAVRRIALGGLTASGRYEVDLDLLVRDGAGVPVPAPRPWTPQAVAVGAAVAPLPEPGTGDRPSPAEVRFIVTCATLAPSGGNTQPWRFTARDATLTAEVDQARSTTLLDFEGRASVLALGAALEGALVGARAAGFTADPVISDEPDGPVWQLDLRRTGAAAATPELALLRERCCLRAVTPSAPIPAETLAVVSAVATPLHVTLIDDRAGLTALGDALGELDRVRFLTPRLYQELVSELRWTPAEALATRDGIDLATLDLGAEDLAALEMLRSDPAMAVLRQLDGGRALGDRTRTAFRTAGAAFVVGSPVTGRRAMVDAGRGLLRLWLAATAQGVGVHPWGSPFLFQRLRDAPDTLGGWERAIVAASARTITRVAALPDDAAVLLVLRLSSGHPPLARSLRRPVEDVLTVID